MNSHCMLGFGNIVHVPFMPMMHSGLKMRYRVRQKDVMFTGNEASVLDSGALRWNKGSWLIPTSSPLCEWGGGRSYCVDCMFNFSLNIEAVMKWINSVHAFVLTLLKVGGWWWWGGVFSRSIPMFEVGNDAYSNCSFTAVTQTMGRKFNAQHTPWFVFSLHCSIVLREQLLLVWTVDVSNERGFLKLLHWCELLIGSM